MGEFDRRSTLQVKSLIACRTFSPFFAHRTSNENSAYCSAHGTHACGDVFWSGFDNFLGLSTPHYSRKYSKAPIKPRLDARAIQVEERLF